MTGVQEAVIPRVDDGVVAPGAPVVAHDVEASLGKCPRGLSRKHRLDFIEAREAVRAQDPEQLLRCGPGARSQVPSPEHRGGEGERGTIVVGRAVAERKQLPTIIVADEWPASVRTHQVHEMRRGRGQAWSYLWPERILALLRQCECKEVEIRRIALVVRRLLDIDAIASDLTRKLLDEDK